MAEAMMQAALDGARRAKAEGNAEALHAYFDAFEVGKSVAEMEGLRFNATIEEIGDPYNLLKGGSRNGQ